MIMKPAIAAMLASGLAVPEKPSLVLPRPAIVKPENLELTRHLLLGMPLTMGMLKPAGPGRPTLISTLEATNSTLGEISTNITIPSGTVLTVCVAQTYFNDGPVTLSSITLGGTGMTAAVAWAQSNNRGASGIYYRAASLSGSTAFSYQVSNNGGQSAHCTFYFFSSYNTTSIVGQTGSTNSSSANSLSLARDPTSAAPFIVAGFVVNNSNTSYSYTNLTNAQDGVLASRSYVSGYNNTLNNPGSTTFGLGNSGSSSFARFVLAEFQSA